MSGNERTPLITTVVVGQRRERYNHSTLRRFCTFCLTITLIVVLILFFTPIHWLPFNGSGEDQNGSALYGLLSSPLPHSSWQQSQGITYDDLQQILLESPSADKAREWSQYYSSGPHLAGKNLSQALWTRERWQEWGVSSAGIATYDVFINYPEGHRLALLEKDNSTGMGALRGEEDAQDYSDEYAVRYECSLEEDVLDEDPTTGLENRIATFHGYSASGDVTAQYVYVNYGTYWDFADLVAANISLKGKIALAKYGRVFRGLKIKRAQELGMIGVVLYSDPQDDGEITEFNGYKAYPNGPARNPSSVQRGSAQFLSLLPGDPTTPGYPSKPGVPRTDPYYSNPRIPSLPISYADALPLLRALNGHGPAASSFNEYWQGGGLSYKGVNYNIGPSPPNKVLNLVNEVSYTITPLWDVIGIINGTLPNEVLVIGNHRDAWSAGGAGDPHSGSAALNEVVRSFGIALSKGWKPLRTLVFASWDGEEYGLVGSTEWVEEYLPWLSGSAIAYLNVDVGAVGPRFVAQASPLLHQALYAATSLVPSPNQTLPGQTIRDLWDGHIMTMGSGSDFTAFQDYAGVPSIDMGFRPLKDSPVYHYHSNYDSWAWMNRYGDPGWRYHVAITKVWALLAANLLESPVLALNASDYAFALETYLDSVKALGNSSSSSSSEKKKKYDFTPLSQAISSFQSAARAFDARAASLAAKIDQDLPWWKWWQKVKLLYAVKVVNEKYKALERQFLYQGGLDGRTWFKHVVFAPGRWTGYAGATFPGLVEGVEDGDWERVSRWVGVVAECVKRAAEVLEI